MKENQEATKEEIDAVITRIQDEFQKLFQKYQASTSAGQANPDDIVEDK
jgi:hypothetical protein